MIEKAGTDLIELETDIAQISAPLNRQEFTEKSIHGWYNFVLGYSDQLVRHLIDKWQLDDTTTVLDAFCGTGTTLVECMKHGIDTVGIDASPFSCFVSRVKTNRTRPPNSANWGKPMLTMVLPIHIV